MEEIKKTKRPTKKYGPFVIIGIVLLTIYTISFLTPLFWALFTSFRNATKFSLSVNKLFLGKGEKYFRPDFFENYKQVYNMMQVASYKMQTIDGREVFAKWHTYNVVGLMVNSVKYAFVCTIMSTLTPCLCAYAVAKYKFKFGSFLYGVVLVTMVMPTIGNLASEMRIAKAIGFYDTLHGIAIMKGHFLGSNFLIFYAAFKSLPNDYKDAAEIDGASQLQVLLKISLPLVSTTISTIALLSFIGFWNDYSTALIYLPSMPTISYGLYYILRGAGRQYVPKGSPAGTKPISSSIPGSVAACMIVTVPIFLVFILLRNKLMGNLTMGGLKG